MKAPMIASNLRITTSQRLYLTALRHPAASASSGVQNHRLPPPLSILILA